MLQSATPLCGWLVKHSAALPLLRPPITSTISAWPPRTAAVSTFFQSCDLASGFHQLGIEGSVDFSVSLSPIIPKCTPIVAGARLQSHNALLRVVHLNRKPKRAHA